MQGIKCAYCEKKYEVKNSHDCCPHCGAFNEFEFNKKINIDDIDLNQFFKNFGDFSNFDEFETKKTNDSNKVEIIKTIKKNNTTKTIKFTKKGSFLKLIWSWFKDLKLKHKLLVLFLIFYFIPTLTSILINDVVDTIEDKFEKTQQRDYNFYYSSSLLEEPNAYLYGKSQPNYVKDYNVNITINGTFDDLYTYVYKNLISGQFHSMEYTLNTSSEINYKNTTIYIDTISFNMNNSSNSISFNYEIEGNDIPSSMKMYLCVEEDVKDRITLASYKEDEYSNLLVYFFDEKSQSYNTFDLNSIGVYKYLYLLIEIDNEVYQIDLKYDNSEASIDYYGFKENSN